MKLRFCSRVRMIRALAGSLGLVLAFAPAAVRSQQAANPSAPLRFDHALICTSDLAPTQQGFIDVGLAPDYGGHHGHASTQMAQLGFPDGTYIGIEAPVTASSATGTPQSDLMVANAGPCGWSVTSSDIKGDLARFARLGVKVGEPEARSRTRPDGTTAEWQSASVGPGAPGSNLPFLMEDKTPRSNRAPRPSASVDGTAITGVKIVILGVKNLDESVALFRKVYGWPAPSVEERKEFGAKVAYFVGTPVMLAAPLKNSWIEERLQKYGEVPVGYLLGTSDFSLTSKHFAVPASNRWFDVKVSWFDAQKLHGIRLGIVGQ